MRIEKPHKSQLSNCQGSRSHSWFLDPDNCFAVNYMISQWVWGFAILSHMYNSFLPFGCWEREMAPFDKQITQNYLPTKRLLQRNHYSKFDTIYEFNTSKLISYMEIPTYPLKDWKIFMFGSTILHQYWCNVESEICTTNSNLCQCAASSAKALIGQISLHSPYRITASLEVSPIITRLPSSDSSRQEQYMYKPICGAHTEMM